MGRVKEILLEMEYKEMEKLPNNNLREYLLTIESEWKPQAYEQENYYLIKYNLLDLGTIESLTICEKVPIDKLNLEIPKQIAEILHETNQYVNTYNRFDYQALINNGWLDSEYLFEAIPLKDSINSLNDLLIIPSSQKALTFYLSQIAENLEYLNENLKESGRSVETSINNVDKALDLMNHIAQD